MNAWLHHIRSHSHASPSPEGTLDATLLVEIDGKVESYAVRVNVTNVVGLESPSSLLEQLRPYHNGSRNLVSALARWVARGSIDYPVLLGDQTEIDTGFATSEVLWPQVTNSKHLLSSVELRWAAKHLSLERSNSLFPCPFEHHVLWEHHQELIPFVTEIDLLTHQSRRARTIVAPKSTVGTRRAAQLDPLDALLLTTLVNTYGPVIEKARVPVEDSVVHSFRFQPEEWGGMWDPNVGFASFEAATDSHIQSGSVDFVVETDVSDFYHRIPARLVGARLEKMGVSPKQADSAARLLGSLSQVGLPVGPSASALFAEAVMASVDNILLSQGVRYARFNDDFRLFCRSEVQANEHLTRLTNALDRLGLSPQEGKTRIWAASAYLEQRQASREWWLRKLGNENAAGPIYGNAAEIPDQRSSSALSVLEKSIDNTHGAWLKLGRAAFKATSRSDRSKVMPKLLSEIARVWALSSDIALVLRNAPASGEFTLLSNEVPISFAVGASKAVDQRALEFALIWILDALRRREWPGRDALVPLLQFVPPSSPARRELVMAVHGFGDEIPFAAGDSDRWSRRCQALLSGIPDRWDSSQVGSAADRFEAELTAAIAETSESID